VLKSRSPSPILAAVCNRAAGLAAFYNAAHKQEGADMKTKPWGIALVVGLAVVAGWARAAVQFVQSPPLTQVVTTPVGVVRPGAVQVPISTWGGDIATLYANGNSKGTAKSSIFGTLGLNLTLVREDVFAKQVDAYLSGRSPYLRGTLGMINMAAEVAGKDPRT